MMGTTGKMRDGIDRLTRDLAACQTKLAAAEMESRGNWIDAEQLAQDLAACRADAERWKAKALRQRTELRRLNKYLGPYWSGFRTGLRMEGECRLRGIMNKAFGHARVYAAEHAALAAARADGSASDGAKP